MLGIGFGNCCFVLLFLLFRYCVRFVFDLVCFLELAGWGLILVFTLGLDWLIWHFEFW